MQRTECNVELGFLRATPLIGPELWIIESSPSTTHPETSQTSLCIHEDEHKLVAHAVEPTPLDYARGSVSPSHDHCTPGSLAPSAGNNSAPGLPTSLANEQNRRPRRWHTMRRRNTMLGYKYPQSTPQNSQCNHLNELEAQRRRHFARTLLPRHLVASCRVPRNLATPQSGCWIQTISVFADVRDFCHWSTA
ncbi:uncharacterized protein PADG_11187 [Paracoccidioides brasiliensis Pb18]|uniref:Uncharacterized protein n=1 Tax=Paracoccidioides brasiliensis (strain Pb18) TaxID=502780 RepID=A0A0A0HUA8_PARBD|nr:uncharacterized protein PADG_11187 [Paracoccidioides brasiliensis Pb18]KGM92729.1 hypothetical protein PADG_11187 [Paracoccidioides brasiliensis Pb18]